MGWVGVERKENNEGRVKGAESKLYLHQNFVKVTLIVTANGKCRKEDKQGEGRYMSILASPSEA